jgi:hypothetical protein
MEVHDLSTPRLTVFREPLLTPALRPVKAGALAVAPEAQAPHGEIDVSGETGQGEKAGTAPVKTEGLDQDAGGDAAARCETESKRASLSCAHAPSVGRRP